MIVPGHIRVAPVAHTTWSGRHAHCLKCCAIERFGGDTPRCTNFCEIRYALQEDMPVASHAGKSVEWGNARFRDACPLSRTPGGPKCTRRLRPPIALPVLSQASMTMGREEGGGGGGA